MVDMITIDTCKATHSLTVFVCLVEFLTPTDLIFIKQQIHLRNSSEFKSNWNRIERTENTTTTKQFPTYQQQQQWQRQRLFLYKRSTFCVQWVWPVDRWGEIVIRFCFWLFLLLLLLFIKCFKFTHFTHEMLLCCLFVLLSIFFYFYFVLF